MSVTDSLLMSEQKLDAWEGELALPKISLEVENEARRLLGLSPTELKQMDAFACGEAAYVLTQFAFFLQRAVNKETARIRWVACAFPKLKNPESVRRANDIRSESQIRKDRISFLAASVSEAARAMMAMQTTKRESRQP